MDSQNRKPVHRKNLPRTVTFEPEVERELAQLQQKGMRVSFFVNKACRQYFGLGQQTQPQSLVDREPEPAKAKAS
jgi:hypothetical protein